MPNLTDDLYSQLQGAPLQQISQQLGVAPQQADTAVSAALPLLLGALGRNASQPEGAQSLFGALNRDHGGMDLGSVLGAVLGGGLGGAGGTHVGASGGLGGLLGGLLGGGQAQGGAGTGVPQIGGRQADADGMLGHIFGDRTQRADEGLGQATGLGSGKAHDLLRILAPIVMSFLAQRYARGTSDAGGLQQALGQERQEIEHRGGPGGGLMGMLDQDGDGKVDLNDLLNAGGGMLGKR